MYSLFTIHILGRLWNTYNFSKVDFVEIICPPGRSEVPSYIATTEEDVLMTRIDENIEFTPSFSIIDPRLKLVGDDKNGGLAHLFTFVEGNVRISLIVCYVCEEIISVRSYIHQSYIHPSSPLSLLYILISLSIYIDN
jgi:hypothetical protein